MPLLEVKELGIDFGGLRALTDVDLTIDAGEIVGLIGPNGAGKTTVFNLLTGVYTPTRGAIRFAGKSIIGKKPYQITQTGIARTFQNIRLFKEMSVLDNIRVAINHTMRYPVISSFFRLPGYWREEREAEERARELLGVFGMGIGGGSDGRQSALRYGSAQAGNPAGAGRRSSAFAAG